MEPKKLKFGKIKEMLTKDQMKKIKGGAMYRCCTTCSAGCATSQSGCGCPSFDTCCPAA